MNPGPWEAWEVEVPAGTTAADLADDVERVTEELVAAAETLSDETIRRPGTFDRWSAKDALAHCLAWSEICAQVVGEVDTGDFDGADYSDLDDDEDELNERQVVELGDISVGELLQRLSLAGQGTAATLRTLEGDPQAALVFMTVIDHFCDHTSELLALEV